jgi:hypothetical protein
MHSQKESMSGVEVCKRKCEDEPTERGNQFDHRAQERTIIKNPTMGTDESRMSAKGERVHILSDQNENGWEGESELGTHF